MNESLRDQVKTKMSKKCVQCGKIFDDQALFCGECGSQLVIVEMPEASKQKIFSQGENAAKAAKRFFGESSAKIGKKTDEMLKRIKTVSMGGVKCPDCGALIMPGADYCDLCGRRLTAEEKVWNLCPTCGAALRPQSCFCPQCGIDLKTYWENHQFTCPRCGNTLYEGDAFCPKCGTAIEKDAIRYELPKSVEIILGDDDDPTGGVEVKSDKSVELEEIIPFPEYVPDKETVSESKATILEAEPTVRFCGYCGAALVEAAAFCPECGHRVS